MGLIDKTGKKVLSKLPDLKIISLARDVMPYISVEAEGLTFFFKNTDHSILDYMVESRKIWACDDMDFILGYYDSISSRPGTVIDIGANVGTSVIYFRNKLGPDTKFYAVEPVTDNFNLLKANCAINGFSDINAFRYGISDSIGEANLEINPANMATCKIAGSCSSGSMSKATSLKRSNAARRPLRILILSYSASLIPSSISMTAATKGSSMI